MGDGGSGQAVKKKKAQSAETAPKGVRCRSSAFAATVFPFPSKERFSIFHGSHICNSGEYVGSVGSSTDGGSDWGSSLTRQPVFALLQLQESQMKHAAVLVNVRRD
jgi:hypothetical protein